MPRAPHLLAAVALAAASAVLPAAAPAVAAEPPAAGTGVVDETWGAPADNDLFTLSATRWDATAGLGTAAVGTGAMTVTAKQDVTFRLSSWYTDPEGVTLHLSGVCPRSIWSQTVAMRAGDTCAMWLTYGPRATGAWHSYVTGLTVSATTPDGATASAYAGQTLSVQHVLVEPEDLGFGEVLVGDTAERAFTIRNITPGPVEVDLSGFRAPFALADGEPGALVVPAGTAAAVRLVLRPTAPGPVSSGWDTRLPTHAVGDATVVSRPYAPLRRGVGVPRTAGVSGAAVDLGAVPEGTEVSAPLEVTNTGVVPVTLSARADAGVRADLPAGAVAPGESVTGTVAWTAGADDLAATVRVVAVDDAPAGVTAADPAEALVPVTGTVRAEPVPPGPGPVDPEPEPAPEPLPAGPEPAPLPADPAPAAADPADPGAAVVASGVLATTGGLVGTGAAVLALLAGAVLVAVRRARA
ncbi:hypothetical protein HNR08_000210 [Cellulomonas hominis]|nr:choice-of-anchor D domain-containing protein [Cellulomonas hominis]MBB5471474.1 hypothetical protein [Cellulomonas hominis]